MSIYAIGDIQGCFKDFKRLLRKIGFDSTRDHLWLTGDLVNRGPDSLDTLRFVKDLGTCATIVLGNHDLHLLACYYGKRTPHRNDTLKAILYAHDRDDLLHWLRYRPLLHYDKNFCLVHAGLPPQWDLRLACKYANKVEMVLRDSNLGPGFFEQMYGDNPVLWKEELDEWAALRFTINALTRMRYCRLDGSIDTNYKGVPGSQPQDLIPWFEHPARKSKDLNILFGHWSSLGILSRKGLYNLDTGCIWGGKLTALEIGTDRLQYIQVDCEQKKRRRSIKQP